MGRLELEFPVSSALRSLGLRPSAFIDVGSLLEYHEAEPDRHRRSSASRPDSRRRPSPSVANTSCTQFNGDAVTGYADDCRHSTPGFKEFFLGNSPSRACRSASASTGFRRSARCGIDLAKALLKQKGDDTKLFSFNVGTQF